MILCFHVTIVKTLSSSSCSTKLKLLCDHMLVPGDHLLAGYGEELLPILPARNPLI